jgi:hypothetical protein
MGSLERRLERLEAIERETATSRIQAVFAGVSNEQLARLVAAYQAGDEEQMVMLAKSWGLTDQDYETALSGYCMLSEAGIQARYDKLHAPLLRRGPQVMQTLARLRAEELDETQEDDEKVQQNQ